MSFIKHGDSNTSEYTTWEGMISRCHNPNATHYDRYGGRGIEVCERWRNYVNFIADMGRRPTPDHTLERLDNSMGYQPGNVKWATRLEQGNNTCRNRIIVIDGETLTVSQAARKFGLSYDTAWGRVSKGIPLDKPIGGPRGKYKPQKRSK